MKPFLRILLPAAVCGLLLGACTQRQTTLKFMSYNIRNGRGIDNVQDLGRVAEIINRTAPDIVALQELDSVTGRMAGRFIPGELGEMTGMHARFCRAIDYCRRNPGTRLVIDAGEYRFSPKNTIGLNSLKNVLIDAEGAVFVFDCDRYFEISGCENFEIKGLAVDWAWDESRLASVVKIEKRNAIKHTFDMRFTELDEVPEDIAVMVRTWYTIINIKIFHLFLPFVFRR